DHAAWNHADRNAGFRITQKLGAINGACRWHQTQLDAVFRQKFAIAFTEFVGRAAFRPRGHRDGVGWSWTQNGKGHPNRGNGEQDREDQCRQKVRSMLARLVSHKRRFLYYFLIIRAGWGSTQRRNSDYCPRISSWTVAMPLSII